MAAGTAPTFDSSFTASDYAAATTYANSKFAQGVDYVAVQVGGDVVVFADNGGTNNALDASDDAVVLIGRSLSDIHFFNIV